MVIDLTDVPIGVAETERELMKLKSGKLIRELININKLRTWKMNYLIIPPSILSIIELHQYFYPSGKVESDLEGLFQIGKIAEFDCYVDLYMDSKTIILQCDKQVLRELRLESILCGESSEDDEIKIKIIY
jgi:hypothetical protein